MTYSASFSRSSRERIILLVGFILLVVSAFLPWAYMVSMFGIITVSGFQILQGEPGIMALLLAVIGSLAVLVYSNTKRLGLISMGLAGVIAFEIGWTYFQISNVISSSEIYSNFGAGLYLCAVAAIVIFLGGVHSIDRAEATTKKRKSKNAYMKYCTNCGAPLSETSSYCGECGQKIEK